MRSPNGRVLGAFLAGLAAGCLGLRLHGSTPLEARADSPEAAGAGEVILVTKDSPSASSAQLLYLVDPAQKVLSVYEYDARKGKMRLSAVRHYAADHQLAEYNNEPPKVAEIEDLVRPR